MGLQFVVMFIDSFMDDVTYVRDVEVCMYNMICYIPGVFVMVLRILYCDLCMMSLLDLLAHSHNYIP